VDILTGKLEWLVNGYDNWETMKSAGQTINMTKSLADFEIGEMKFPETKIGETVTKAEDWLKNAAEKMEIKQAPAPPPAPTEPPKIPLPPRIRPSMHTRRGGK
jgi:hypothetical protein